MRFRKSLYIFLVAVFMLTACGDKETNTKGNVSIKNKVEEIVGESKPLKEFQDLIKEKSEQKKSAITDIEKEPVENIEEPSNSQQLSKPSATQPTTTTKPVQEKPSTTKPSTVKPTGNTTTTIPTPTPTPATPAPEIKECEHWYQPEFQEKEYIKHYVFGCNGCGYPLFTLEGNDAVNLPDLYVHPACETDRYDEPCTGGGFHSEVYTRGFCGICHDEIIRRQCMFSVMGLRCIKNEALGPYEKVEEGQNPMAYIKACSCGANQIYLGDSGNCLLFVKETCTYCGDVKLYPQK